jgi:hypothetical protein
MTSNRFAFVRDTLLKVFGFGLSIAEAAVEVRIIQPEERQAAPHVYVLPGQIGRAIRGVDGHSTLKDELEPFRSEEIVHAPVVRYTLRDCLVHPHGVDFMGGRLSKATGRQRLRALTRPAEHVDKAIYCMTPVAHQYFGHWLRDACATALLAQQDEDVLLDARSDWPHAAQYVDAFELHARDATPAVLVHELTVYQDFSQGSSKRARYEQLRQRAAARFGTPSGQGQPVYLRRGSTGTGRLIQNEEAVVSHLEGMGFKVLDIANLTARELYLGLAASPMVVGIEGSHLNHVYMAMKKGGNLLVLMPADRFSATHYGVSSALDIRFGFLIADARPNGYHVDLDELTRTLALMP